MGARFGKGGEERKGVMKIGGGGVLGIVPWKLRWTGMARHLHLSWQHSQLIKEIIEEFVPRFAPGAMLIRQWQVMARPILKGIRN